MSDLEHLIEVEGLAPCQLTAEATEEDEERALIVRLVGFIGEHEAVDGWLTMQSQVLIVREGGLYRPERVARPYREEPLEHLSKLGMPINGELGCSEASLQWHWQGAGWRLVSLEEGKGESCWFEEVTHLGDQRKQQPVTQFDLTYRRFWHRDGGIRPFAARLVGFRGGEA